MNEEKLAILFENAVRRISLSEEKVAWAKEVLAESRKSRATFQDRKISSLVTQRTKLETRLSNLYDLRVDGEISDAVFRQKEREDEGMLFDVKLSD